MVRLPACASLSLVAPLAAALLASVPALAARPASRPPEAPPSCGGPALHRTAFVPAAGGRWTGGCPSLLSTRSLVRPPGIHAL